MATRRANYGCTPPAVYGDVGMLWGGASLCAREREGGESSDGQSRVTCKTWCRAMPTSGEILTACFLFSAESNYRARLRRCSASRVRSSAGHCGSEEFLSRMGHPYSYVDLEATIAGVQEVLDRFQVTAARFRGHLRGQNCSVAIRRTGKYDCLG